MLCGSTFDPPPASQIPNHERGQGTHLVRSSPFEDLTHAFIGSDLRTPSLRIQVEDPTIVWNSPFADSNLKYLFNHFPNSELSFRPLSSDAWNATSGYTSIRPTLCYSICSSTCLFILRHCSGPTSTKPGSLDGLPGDRDLPPREGLVNSKLNKLQGANMRHCQWPSCLRIIIQYHRPLISSLK